MPAWVAAGPRIKLAHKMPIPLRPRCPAAQPSEKNYTPSRQADFHPTVAGAPASAFDPEKDVSALRDVITKTKSSSEITNIVAYRTTEQRLK